MTNKIRTRATNPSLPLTPHWQGYWITHPDLLGNEPILLRYQKKIVLKIKPQKFDVRVSADSRYKLFVNGKIVTFGPQRSDLDHYKYETLSLADEISEGENLIEALVWNFGSLNPVGELSWHTAYLMDGDLITDENWEVRIENGFKAIPLNENKVKGYICVGPEESFDSRATPGEWKKPIYWGMASSRGVYPQKSRWYLEARNIPLMRYEFRKGTEQPGLYDNKILVTGFPTLHIQGESGAEVKLTYAEGLLNTEKRKGNRNEIEAKTCSGNEDYFILNGEEQTFQTLWWRTFRFVDIQTKGKVQKLSFDYFETGYPLNPVAVFSSADERHAKMFEIGLRTQRLCCGETYFDCPYYEQLQYAGDTRIQMIHSYLISQDDRLARNALTQMGHAMLGNYLQSRYPGIETQIIPSFSFFLICSFYDYYWYRGDLDFLRQFFLNAGHCLDFYGEQIDSRTGVFGPLEFWNFVDWGFQPRGIPPSAASGGSILSTLIYILALKAMSALDPGRSNFKKRATELSKSIFKRYFDKNKGLLPDDIQKTSFSQHTQILAVLADVYPRAMWKQVMEKVLSDSALIQCTFYFHYYLFRALKKTGLGHLFLSRLGPWYTMYENGLTTWAEDWVRQRSDCHAWSVSPNIEFLSTVLGIEPACPGFDLIEIRPELGPLKWAAGKVAHPKGIISIEIDEEGNGQVILPRGTRGHFHFKNIKKKLRPGINKFR